MTVYVQFRRYVAELSMNSTANGSSGSWSCLNFSALKIGGTVTYWLIIIVSLVANSLVVIIVFISPDFLAFELVEYPEGAWCVRRWKKVFGESSSFASWLLAYNILFTYIPVLLLIILYSIIFIKLKTQAHPGEQSTNNQQQRKRRNRNVLQMSIAIVTVFVLCWLPYNTNHLIIEYQDRSAHFSCSFQIYFAVTYFTAHAYCAINPIICFMFSSNYRQGVKRLMKCSFVLQV